MRFVTIMRFLIFKRFMTFMKFMSCMEFIMFLFDVPKRHTTNYKKFINGEYSKLTARYKEDILKFHGLDITSQLGQIIFKSEKRKLMLENTLNIKLDDDAELYSIIDSNEIFNPKYYL